MAKVLQEKAEALPGAKKSQVRKIDRSSLAKQKMYKAVDFEK